MVKQVVLEVDGIKIVGQLYLPGESYQSPYPTVCVCHGIPAERRNAGYVGYRLLAERICHQGFAVFIFNFRGTGDSGGNLDLLGWTRDLKAAINYLCTLPELDSSRLLLLGFSGGAAVSIYVAAQDSRVSSIAVCASPAEFTFLTKGEESTSLIDHFRSIGTIRDKDFPHSAEKWFSGFRMISPIKHVAGIAPRPLLLVHGSKDELVDVNHAHRLYDKAGEPKQLIIVNEAGHRLRGSNKAITIVINWLKSHAQTSG